MLLIVSIQVTIRLGSQSSRALKTDTDLEDTPGDTTHGFSKGQNREGRGEDGNKDGNCHPTHEEHHCTAAAKPILAYRVDY
jgi:hypothetical protein